MILGGFRNILFENDYKPGNHNVIKDWQSFSIPLLHRQTLFFPLGNLPEKKL